jgi:hypothetical protein
MLRSKCFLAFALFLLVACCSLDAAVIRLNGANSALDARGGVFYIPFSQAHSGPLGNASAEGMHVGNQDSVRLKNASSSGYADVLLNYDLGPSFTPTESHLDLSGAAIAFTWGDLDFLPAPLGGVSYYETIELTFLAHATDAPAATPDLTLDRNTYMHYRTSAGTATDDVKASYTIPLTDLGLSNAEAAGIDANKGFSLLVRYIAHLDNAGTTSTSVLYKNTSESASESYLVAQVVPDKNVPEPASVSLLILAAGALWRRR